MLNQLSAGGLLAAVEPHCTEAREVGGIGSPPGPTHCSPQTISTKNESSILPCLPLQLFSNPELPWLSHSPDKNLLHLLQPVHLLHPAGRETEDKGFLGRCSCPGSSWQAGGCACPCPLPQAPCTTQPFKNVDPWPLCRTAVVHRQALHFRAAKHPLGLAAG